MFGTSTESRLGYLDMLCAITEGQVGAVFSLESTRLGRDSADWHHLIKICHVTDTLIIDPDGVYDASDSNDSTLMKFKALIGDMELRLIASRMRGAMLKLAEKGELRLIQPAGFVYSDQGAHFRSGSLSSEGGTPGFRSFRNSKVRARRSHVF